VSFPWSQFGPFILIYLNLVPIFVKNSNFVPLQIETKINLYKCYTNIFIKFDIFIQINILLYIFNIAKFI